jgi:3-methyl-2-oxobutanoate hydroxymethyltransferase
VFSLDKTKRITVLTCYDYPTACAINETDIDIVFVGDSVGTNMLGYKSELEVSLGDMVHHLRAVRKGISKKPLMVGLPFQTYPNPETGLKNSMIMKNEGADVIKLEGGMEISEIIKAIVNYALPVIGHIGFQPQISQSAKRAVVGAYCDEAVALFQHAIALEKAGVSGIVLECVPEDVAKAITEKLNIPTIGIGSGRYTTGQVLVIADILGWFSTSYRFTKKYDNFYDRTIKAANSFASDVKVNEYPQREHTFRIKADQFKTFLEYLHDNSKD